MTLAVILIDDHPLFRTGLRHLLTHSPGVAEAGQFADIASVRAWLEEGGRADVALLDRTLGDADGLALVPDLQRHGIKVVMLTIAEEDYEIREAIKKGVDGYILKSSEPAQILQAIHAVHQGGSVFPDHIRQTMARGAPRPGGLDKLTQRELEIVGHVARGLSNRAIGEALGLSENTVRNHLRSILEKLGMTNRVQVATFALKHGIGRRSEPSS